jgi:SAM-dependent MidA family methyltransferase
VTGPAPESGSRTPIDDAVAARIRRLGPLGFAEVMELALYDPDHGFYASSGQAGRRGDFLTSPEVGPLFGAVLANALDAWWADAGCPDPFVVVEAAAGSAMLARTVLLAEPACRPALTYVLVERSAALRALHGDHLELTAPELAFPPGADDDGGSDERTAPVVGTGPRVVSLASLPAFACAHVVFANELLDNLPIDVLEACGPPGPNRTWDEVRVALAADDVTLIELTVPTSPSRSARADRLAPDAASGARIPLADAACEWLRDALATVRTGRVVVIDYGEVSADLAARPMGDWLRTYRAHDRGEDPLRALGTQDITAEVAIDQLAAVASIDRVEAQAELLTRFGIEELVDEGRRIWHERAGAGDLEAVRARSRVREAEALLDPTGLGAFRVLEWLVP